MALSEEVKGLAKQCCEHAKPEELSFGAIAVAIQGRYQQIYEANNKRNESLKKANKQLEKDIKETSDKEEKKRIQARIQPTYELTDNLLADDLTKFYKLDKGTTQTRKISFSSPSFLVTTTRIGHGDRDSFLDFYLRNKGFSDGYNGSHVSTLDYFLYGKHYQHGYTEGQLLHWAVNSAPQVGNALGSAVDALASHNLVDNLSSAFHAAQNIAGDVGSALNEAKDFGGRSGGGSGGEGIKLDSKSIEALAQLGGGGAAGGGTIALKVASATTPAAAAAAETTAAAGTGISAGAGTVGSTIQAGSVSGIPAISGGTPTAVSGIPAISGGTPTAVSGIPAISGGTPTAVSGIPAISGGTPTAVSGIPAISGGTPTAVPGIPAITGGTPTVVPGDPVQVAAMNKSTATVSHTASETSKVVSGLSTAALILGWITAAIATIFNINVAAKSAQNLAQGRKVNRSLGRFLGMGIGFLIGLGLGFIGGPTTALMFGLIGAYVGQKAQKGLTRWWDQRTTGHSFSAKHLLNEQQFEALTSETKGYGLNPVTVNRLHVYIETEWRRAKQETLQNLSLWGKIVYTLFGRYEKSNEQLKYQGMMEDLQKGKITEVMGKMGAEETGLQESLRAQYHAYLERKGEVASLAVVSARQGSEGDEVVEVKDAVDELNAEGEEERLLGRDDDDSDNDYRATL